MTLEALSKIAGYIMSQPIVDLPFLMPLVRALEDVPILNVLIHLILWRPVFAVIFTPGLIALTIALLYIIWFERKLTAKVQWRYGPLEISRRVGGILQPLADALRYAFQEFVIPMTSDKWYFVLTPPLLFLFSTLPVLFIPIGPNKVVNGVVEGIFGVHTGFDIPIALALCALFTIGVIIIGWASNDRFTYIGTVREALMYTGCELVLILSIVAMMVLYQTADPFKAVEWQLNHLPGIIANPLAFLAFAIATLMATSRFPFEIPDAESEIVQGPFTEYSGVMYALVMTLNYEKLYILSMLGTLLFLNGWEGPYIPQLGALSYAIWFGIKTLVLMMIFVFTRSIYGRYRIDQALRLSWSSLFGLVLAALILSLAIRAFVG